MCDRERDVLRGIARGLTNAEIASELGIGFETVKTYVSRLRVYLEIAYVPTSGRRQEALVAAARRYFDEDDTRELAS